MSRLAALALAAALALGLVGCDTSSIVPGGSGDVMPNPAASQTGTTPSDGQDAAFQMHFIDVGQALSVLVECDGQFMLYDGGNVDDGSLVVSYLQSQGVEQLEYVFCSHAHEDHVGGLAAALAYFPACHVYSPVTEAYARLRCYKEMVLIYLFYCRNTTMQYIGKSNYMSIFNIIQQYSIFTTYPDIIIAIQITTTYCFRGIR